MAIDHDPKTILASLFAAAVAAADPYKAIKANLPARPKGRTIVVGAGKASGEMARAFEALWDGPLEGVVVTRRGSQSPCNRIEIIEASHPVPDVTSLMASRRLMGAVSGLTEDDLIVALISGGGSSLLALPCEGLTLEDEAAVAEVLLASGASIAAMNVVRTQLSAIKGGRLALAASPAKVVTLIVSDIPGDEPGLVASGPTIATRASPAEALRVIDQYRLRLPVRVMNYLSSRDGTDVDPDHPCFARNEVKVIVSAAASLEAAAIRAEKLGVPAIILGDAIEGEAREVAMAQAATADDILRRDGQVERPLVRLSGGECTVTLRGDGKGGRNTEFLLALATEIAGRDGIFALAADTDGIDGSEDNAGAFADGSTVTRLAARGLEAHQFLARNDAWTAFNAVDDLFVTGPTGTNVNDFRAILIM
jgi:hydroxypyruvate reductase